MRTWVEIGGEPLPFEVAVQLVQENMLTVRMQGLTLEDTLQIEEQLETEGLVEVCTQYYQDTPAIREVIEAAMIGAKENSGDLYSLLIHSAWDVVIPSGGIASWYKKVEHGLGFGRD